MRDVVAIAYIAATLYLWVDVAVTIVAMFRPALRPLRRALDRWLSVSFLGLALGNVMLGHQVWAGTQFACAALMFWTHRDDDYWKRLRNRADSVVRDLGHRLTIAPSPVGVNA